MSSPFLEGLNPNQRAAAGHVQGPLLVLAGAGSGKTRVITHRIAHLIHARHAKPGEILAVTFTNKAAGEMRERIGGLVSNEAAKRITIATFHSFCLRVLRKHITKLGYRPNFTIAGESDSRTMLRRIVDDMGARDAFDPGRFHAEISLHKNAHPEAADDPESGKGSVQIRSDNDEKYAVHFHNIRSSYQSALRAANCVDFDDLLLLTLRLWQEHPDVLEAFRARLRFVLVDEYQDTNAVQLALLRLLSEEHRNLCVVGDDDQSIYAWRGADVRNILAFEKHFPDATIITLDQNYRSTQTILDAANHVIKQNTNRREKQLWSELGQGRPIELLVVGDEDEEARHAVGWLKTIQKKTGARYRDFALLYRSNQQSKPIEIAFRKAGIPYTVYGGQDFFERAEVRDVIAYLKVLANPNDEAAFLRIVNMPRRGIGDATLHMAHDVCRAERVSCVEALHRLIQRGALNGPTESGVHAVLDLIERYAKRMGERETKLRSVAEDLILEIGYRDELERVCKGPRQLEARWQNVELVLGAVEQYQADAKNPSLAGFLDESHLNRDGRGDQAEQRRDGVSLMTVHSAKGLEFPYVFIMGAEDGLMPHDRSVKENTLDEERRLFYVALTRGKRHVSMFQALTRTRNGRERPTEPSRFLADIPEDHIRVRTLATRDMAAAQAQSGAVQDEATPAKKPRKVRSKPS